MGETGGARRGRQRGGGSSAEIQDRRKRRASSYYMAGADRDDVIQEGMIRVFKAIRDYDPEKGASFSTFADLCINRQIVTAVKPRCVTNIRP